MVERLAVPPAVDTVTLQLCADSLIDAEALAQLELAPIDFVLVTGPMLIVTEPPDPPVEYPTSALKLEPERVQENEPMDGFPTTGSGSGAGGGAWVFFGVAFVVAGAGAFVFGAGALVVAFRVAGAFVSGAGALVVAFRVAGAFVFGGGACVVAGAAGALVAGAGVGVGATGDGVGDGFGAGVGVAVCVTRIVTVAVAVVVATGAGMSAWLETSGRVMVKATSPVSATAAIPRPTTRPRTRRRRGVVSSSSRHGTLSKSYLLIGLPAAGGLDGDRDCRVLCGWLER